MTHGISWFGSTIVTMNLLRKSKEGKIGNESFADKVARNNFDVRVGMVRRGLNSCGGTTLAAAELIQQGFFTDVPAEVLESWLVESIENLGKPINAPKAAFGDLDFAAAADEAAQTDDQDNQDNQDNQEEDWEV